MPGHGYVPKIAPVASTLAPASVLTSPGAGSGGSGVGEAPAAGVAAAAAPSSGSSVVAASMVSTQPLSVPLRALLARHNEERSARASAARAAGEAVTALAEEVAGNARACLGAELRAASTGARAVELGFGSLAGEGAAVSKAAREYSKDYALLAASVRELGSVAAWLHASETCLQETIVALEASAVALTTDETAA